MNRWVECVVLFVVLLLAWGNAHAEGAPTVTFQGLTVNATAEERDEFLAQYSQLAEPKAIAMALGKDGSWAMGWSERSEGVLPAIGAAIAGCERARQRKGVEAPCELLRVNDDELELGLALQKRLALEGSDGPALMWRFQNKRATVYLGGSLHGFKGSLYPLPPAFEQAYSAADELVLEVNVANLTQQKLIELQQKYALLPDGKTLDDVLSGSDLDEVRQFVSTLGVPWQGVNRLTPAALAQELTMAIMMTQGMMPNYGFEQHYLARALQERKRIGELETIEFQFELLSRMPIDLQAEQSDFVVEELKGTLAEMLDAWYRADLGQLEALIKQEGDKSPELNAFYKELFDERNSGMAKKIEALLKKRKGTYLVLVGAGHLAGEHSVINLLKRRGFDGVQLQRSFDAVVP